MQENKLSDRKILEVARKVSVVPEPAFDKGYPAKLKTRVAVVLNTGETFKATNAKVKGDHDCPLTDAEIQDKFVWMSKNRLNPDQARGVIDEVWSLEAISDMAGFTERLNTMCGH
jgi:2-methylcitrate dehydratase PrpD